MRSYGLILDIPKDLQKVISNLSDRIIIYGDKINKHEKRKLFRRENAKFELYRGRFYRDLSDKNETMNDVPDEEIKNTWSKMWELDTGEADEDLLDEYVLEYKGTKDDSICFPTLDEFMEIIKWLPCWKAAGPDRIFNFFIKKMTTIHNDLYKVIKTICLDNEQPEEWFFRGITHLIPKGIPQSGKDFRPITCMSNLYKLTTKCVTAVMQIMVEERKLISDNQMGTMRKVLGAKEQMLTNIMLNKANNFGLKTAWIDVKKAFDSVTHKYLIKCIERLGLPDWITKFMKLITSKWN
ncbi:hypothetical protein NAPIS_ORF00357 [Vairimorpha apis BRL 01]|uniref:Reverse transcriptase domain-containing protein n=1 Tax=Vairimorpha apis BRL 01 TaxID=1037528 RepID=T0L3J8_9MICR|nr:hypothetical protein NAPIS_ORF00357 [Vairimorpha apis BRL 01]